MIALLLPLLFATAMPSSDLGPRDPVLRALVEGEAAQAQGDGATLGEKAQLLTALGATPAPGQQDLASLWTSEAQSRGCLLYTSPSPRDS